MIIKLSPLILLVTPIEFTNNNFSVSIKKKHCGSNFNNSVFYLKLLLDHNTIHEALSNLSTHINKDYSTGNLVLLGVLTVDLSRKLSS